MVRTLPFHGKNKSSILLRDVLKVYSSTVEHSAHNGIVTSSNLVKLKYIKNEF